MLMRVEPQRLERRERFPTMHTNPLVARETVVRFHCLFEAACGAGRLVRAGCRGTAEREQLHLVLRGVRFEVRCVCGGGGSDPPIKPKLRGRGLSLQ